MKVGVHVSIKGGFRAAARTAVRIGCGAYQYFPKNPRSLSLKQFDASDAAAAAAYNRTHNLVSVAHAPYLANPAADDPAYREAVERSLLNDLLIAESCGSLGVIVHFGHSRGERLQGYKNVLQCLNNVVSVWDGAAKLLLENEAGQHGTMGTTMEEAAYIRRLVVRPEAIGFCLDTCHAYASGHWPEDADASSFATWLEQARACGYLRHLSVVHLNDSVFPHASRRDRHADVGKGYIGATAFSRFLQLEEIRHLPFILETPAAKRGTQQEELARVRHIASASCS